MSVSTDKLPCPNCGTSLIKPSTLAPFTCESCGEELGVSQDQKIVLLRPIARYRDLAEETRDRLSPHHHYASEQPPTSTEYRRKMLSIERAFDRIDEEIENSSRNRTAGIALMVFGLFFAVIMIAREYFSTDALSWVDLLAPVLISLGLIAAGAYMTASAITISNASHREARELQRELAIIEGIVAHDS